jgi:hypothetical protein
VAFAAVSNHVFTFGAGPIHDSLIHGLPLRINAAPRETVAKLLSADYCLPESRGEAQWGHS